jgi:nucleotide-binding universal stress UspA family protein
VRVRDRRPIHAAAGTIQETPMFEQVIVGIDGRANGRDAIELARRLIASGGELTLVHVRDGRLHPSHAITPSMIDNERTASEELLERECDAAELERDAVGRESVVALSPGRGLHEEAQRIDADLLVVGSTSRGPFGRAMLGDDTRGALNGAPCAVAVAVAGYAEAPTPIAKIGVAYNESPESELALAAARDLATLTRALVLVREVVAIPTYAYTGLVVPPLEQGIEDMLASANGRLQKLAGVDAKAVYGLTGEELAAFGDEVDLLVTGSRDYGPLRRLVVGSTSDYLQRHARCSLLVLPRGADA